MKTTRERSQSLQEVVDKAMELESIGILKGKLLNEVLQWAYQVGRTDKAWESLQEVNEEVTR